MNIHRRSFIVGAAIASLSTYALAGDRIPYEAASFQAAQEAGKPIIVHIFATWCETCQAQAKVLNALQKEADFAAVTIFVVDYDAQKDVMRGFNATSRSTLIAFKGKAELGRLVGDTSSKSIRALLQKTV